MFMGSCVVFMGSGTVFMGRCVMFCGGEDESESGASPMIVSLLARPAFLGSGSVDVATPLATAFREVVQISLYSHNTRSRSGGIVFKVESKTFSRNSEGTPPEVALMISTTV